MSEALATTTGLVLAVLGAWALWLRRAGVPTQGDAIHVVTSRYLGAKERVTLIEVDGERLLLGVTGDRVQLVARLGGPAPAAARADGSPAVVAPRAQEQPER